jgi:hypothetical protein
VSVQHTANTVGPFVSRAYPGDFSERGDISLNLGKFGG